MTNPLASHAQGQRVAYGVKQGTDHRGRPAFRVWVRPRVVVAPKMSENLQPADGITGWMDLDRLTLYLPDSAVEGVADMLWWPFATAEFLELVPEGGYLDTAMDARMGETYLAAGRAFVWRSPFTGAAAGTQLDIISQKVVAP